MINGVSDIIKQGIRLIIKEFKFVWLFFLCNIAFAIVLTLPLYYILQEHLIHSSMSGKLTFGFDYIWYLQFRSLYKLNIGQIPFIIYGTTGIYILIQIFFLGGIISVFNTPKKNHYVDFFYGGVKYWYRFFKILLISILSYALAFAINDLLGYLITLGFQNVEARIWEFILRASRYILLVFLIGIVSIISDYSKISLALKDHEKVLKEIFRTIVFIKRNFNRLFLVFLIVAIIGAAGAVIYNILDNFLPKTNYVYFLLAFILQQLLIIFRLLVRMLFSATEVILFKDLNAEFISVKVEEVV